MNVKGIKDKIRNDIINNKSFFRYKNLLIVGENNSGKSKLLKDIISYLKGRDQNIYFIDSTNRNITDKREELVKSFEHFSIEDILLERIKVDNFNKRDVFSNSDGNEIILNELFKNFDEYKLLFNEVLDLNIEKYIENSIGQLETEEYITVDNDKLEIVSDGMQAMIRILMEVNFANKENCSIVFIDELNMNLDHINSWEFIEKLKEKYCDIRFVLTSHSLYTVLGVKDFDIIKIIKQYEISDDNLCQIFDSNDLDNPEIVDRKLFESNRKKSEVDVFLSNFTKLILSEQQPNDDEITKFNSLDNLTVRQQIIYDFLKERMSHEDKVSN